MARLILLNGPPGSGKSTLAQRFVADHPPAADLDIDRIRALLGGGHDVIVPQFLGRIAFVDQIADLAEDGALSR